MIEKFSGKFAFFLTCSLVAINLSIVHLPMLSSLSMKSNVSSVRKCNFLLLSI